MAIKCAHCKDYHPSVAAVRACAGVGAASPQTVRFIPNNRGGYAPTGGRQLPLPADGEGVGGSRLNGVITGSESGTLHRASPVERIRAAAKRLPFVAHCSYALQEQDGTWKFYRVDRPKTGKWTGYTFVKVQASDYLWPIKNLTSVYKILEAIAEDPAKAASDYGHQIGKCGICSRTLTDPESIDRGIGPVCAGKAGW